MRKQKRWQENSQSTSVSRQANDKSLYIVAFGGVAAGLTLALIAWLVNAIVTKDDSNITRPESSIVIQASEITKVNENIDLLYERVELITAAVSNLEAKLAQITPLTDGDAKNEYSRASSPWEEIYESSDAKTESNSEEPYTSIMASGDHGTAKNFAPTHMTNARVNLRPSSSLDVIPIATLKIGSKVEYISESEGWYYVNTQFYGKGWCSSDYLSLLPSNKADISGAILDL